jgi:hypothetical protein
MNFFVTVPDDGCLMQSFGAFMREPGHRPTLADILGAACELYRTDPDSIASPGAALATRTYCYFATRWSGEPFNAIGALVGVDHHAVAKLSRGVMNARKQDSLLRDDLDLLAVRIAERVLTKKRAR